MDGYTKEAIELLARIYNREAGYQLSDSGMVEEWIDEEIAAFIRRHGSFDGQLRQLHDAHHPISRTKKALNDIGAITREAHKRMP